MWVRGVWGPGPRADHPPPPRRREPVAKWRALGATPAALQAWVSAPGNAPAPPARRAPDPRPHLGVGGQQVQVAVVTLLERPHLAAQLPPVHRVPVEDAQAQLLRQGEQRLSLRGQHLQGLGAAP